MSDSRETMVKSIRIFRLPDGSMEFDLATDNEMALVLLAQVYHHTKNPLKCVLCSSSDSDHTHTLTKNMVKFLVKMYQVSPFEPVNIRALGFGEYGDRTNFCKLKYWGMIDRYVTAENKHKAGWWKMLEPGRQFVQEKFNVRKIAITHNNVVVRMEGDLVSIRDVDDAYFYRGDYVATARPHVMGT